ncbi:hypothetical protein ABTX82_38700 [Streptomyces lavendulae]|nr:hypothetical protein [Streptomyces lavendulae]GLW03611.1 hypothetical protein Slala05_72410 [Streptomyces lavendulae subsp. lavendulae]
MWGGPGSWGAYGPSGAPWKAVSPPGWTGTGTGLPDGFLDAAFAALDV